MKETRERIFQEALEKVEDEAYRAWLVENKAIFITRPRTQKKAYLEALEEDSPESGLEGVEIRKGEIWYADLDPGGSGKIRPVVIWQNDLLNRAVTLGIYHSIIVLPVSSRLYGGVYRYRIEAREKMPKTSEIVCNAIGLVGSNRIMANRGVLTTLTFEEEREIKKIVMSLFD